MISPLLIAFERATVGRQCAVERRDADWVFLFGGDGAEGCFLTTDALWRVVEGGRIRLTSEDDRQQFGLPAPVDAQDTCRRIFHGRSAHSVSVDPVTADVTIRFDADVRLEIMSTSSGYESWQARFRHADQDVTLIGAGGGSLCFVSAPAGSNPGVLVGRPLADF